MFEIGSARSHPSTMPVTAWCSRGLSSEPLEVPGRYWVVVDTETTGLDPTRHRLREAAAVVLAPDLAEVARYAWSDAEGHGALAAWGKLVEPHLLQGVFVAHHLRFDLAFLEADAVLGSRPLVSPARWLCTLNLSGGRRSLAALAAAESLDSIAPHTAIGDAATLSMILRSMHARATARSLESLAGLAVVSRVAARPRRVAEHAETWQALVESLTHVVPVRPLTREDRDVVAALFDLRDPHCFELLPGAIQDASEALQRASVSRISFLRLLDEAGHLDPADSAWADAFPH